MRIRAEEGTWNTLKASTPVKLRWIGDAVPGRVVKSSFHLPSSSGDWVGACTSAFLVHMRKLKSKLKHLVYVQTSTLHQ